MKIAHWDVANVRHLAHVYNEQLADVPHCYPISPEEFESGIRDPQNSRHCKDLHAEKIIVAEEDGKIIGFAHIVMGKIEFSDRERAGGLIHFLTYSEMR